MTLLMFVQVCKLLKDYRILQISCFCALIQFINLSHFVFLIFFSLNVYLWIINTQPHKRTNKQPHKLNKQDKQITAKPSWKQMITIKNKAKSRTSMCQLRKTLVFYPLFLNPFLLIKSEEKETKIKKIGMDNNKRKKDVTNLIYSQGVAKNWTHRRLSNWQDLTNGEIR